MEEYNVTQLLFVIVSIFVIHRVGYIQGFIKGKIDALSDKKLMMEKTIHNIENNVENSVEVCIYKVEESWYVYRKSDNQLLVKGNTLEETRVKLMQLDSSKFFWCKRENIKE